MAGSVIEQLKIIDPLTNPTAHGASASDAFHLVIPSMPGYGFSGKPTATGWDPARIARAWVHRDRVGMPIRRCTGEQVKCGGGQGVLVGAAIDVRSDQLLGRGVGNGPDGDVGLGNSADLGELASYSEIRQQDPLFVLLGMGEQDVGGFHIAVQQSAGVGVVERARDSGDDRADVLLRTCRPGDAL